MALSVVPRIDLCPTDLRISCCLGLDWHPFSRDLGGMMVGPAFYVEYYNNYAQSNELTTVGIGASLGYRYISPSGMDATIKVVGAGVGLKLAGQGAPALMAIGALQIAAGMVF